jgi:hypothetical protein
MIEAQHTLEDQNIRFKLNEAEHGKDTTQALREIRGTNAAPLAEALRATGTLRVFQVL